jgi:hypothetical protein
LWEQLALVTAVFLGCLAPAAINSLPVVFVDTDGYIAAASMFRSQHIRAFSYNAFIGITGGVRSLWLTVAAQAALTAWVGLARSRWTFHAGPRLDGRLLRRPCSSSCC